jgi:hypothetical protein
LINTPPTGATGAEGATGATAAGATGTTGATGATGTEFVPLAAADLTIDPSMTVDEATRDEFLAVVNDRALAPKDMANKLIGLQTKMMKAQSEKSTELYTKMQTDWQNEVRADKDVGGDKLDGVLSGISRVVDKYGSAELRQMMDITGVGNNVHMVRFMNKLAVVLNEPSFVPGSPVGSKKSQADTLYS